MAHRKILLLTPTYPAPDFKNIETEVVHFFTREWVKEGHEVLVMHYLVNFPKIINVLAAPFKEIIATRTGGPIRLDIIGEGEYEKDGVHVKRLPLTKWLPHTRYPKREVHRVIRKTKEFCESISFNPDVIISHWVNPQLEIAHELKKYFTIPTCFIAHDSGRDLINIYNKDEVVSYLKDIDVIGYRSKSIKTAFERNFKINIPSFICKSGIPEEFLPEEGFQKKITNIDSFLYIGGLVQRKFPAQLIPALCKSFGNNHFELTYAGEGKEVDSIETNKSMLAESQQVLLLGKVSREDLIPLIKEKEVFIMISRCEAYGLVYLEAMAGGCITIASRNEGFDGIIEHGVNGFLCEAGNVEELANLVTEIRQMPQEDLQLISNNAISTARSLTDRLAAMDYLNNVFNIIGK